MISVISSFIALEFHSIMVFFIDPIHFRIMSQFIVTHDNFIGFLCLSFTMECTDTMYQKSCCIFNECMRSIMYCCCVRHVKNIDSHITEQIELLSLTFGSSTNNNETTGTDTTTTAPRNTPSNIPQ
eukprot:UN04224